MLSEPLLLSVPLIISNDATMDDDDDDDHHDYSLERVCCDHHHHQQQPPPHTVSRRAPSTTTTTTTTTTTIQIVTTTLRLCFFFITGCIIGTESAHMGLFLLHGNDDNHHKNNKNIKYSMIHSLYQYYSDTMNNSSDSDDTVSSSIQGSTTKQIIVQSPILLQQIHPIRDTVALSFGLALIWSVCTILLTFLSYHMLRPILQCFENMFQLLQQRRHSSQETFIQNMDGISNIRHEHANYDENDNEKVGAFTDKEYNEFMITIGSCLGFTTTCYFYG